MSMYSVQGKTLPCSPKLFGGLSIAGLVIVAAVTTLAVVLTRTSPPTATCIGTITSEGEYKLPDLIQYILSHGGSSDDHLRLHISADNVIKV